MTSKTNTGSRDSEAERRNSSFSSISHLIAVRPNTDRCDATSRSRQLHGVPWPESPCPRDPYGRTKETKPSRRVFPRQFHTRVGGSSTVVLRTSRTPATNLGCSPRTHIFQEEHDPPIPRNYARVRPRITNTLASGNGTRLVGYHTPKQTMHLHTGATTRYARYAHYQQRYMLPFSTN